MTDQPSVRPRRRWRLLLLINWASCLLVLGVAELAVRISDHQVWTTRNFVLDELAVLHSQYPMEFDQRLGWVPRPNTTSTPELWGRTVTITILPDGTRSNGSHGVALNSHPIVLAVGDSYTFGDEVSDSETWPSWLEQQLQSPVINGGVVGYGIDQTYLRAKELITRYHPDILIVSFIDDDIGRAEFSERHHAEKPYFDIAQGELSLMNTPLPPPRSHHGGMWLRKSLGHSLLVHRLMRAFAPGFWFNSSRNSIHMHDHGTEVACLLMRDLTRLANEHHLRTIVLVQDDLSDPRPLTCLDPTVVEIVEMGPSLKEQEATDPHGFREKFFYTCHMSSFGNHFVASKLFQQISGGAHPSDTQQPQARPQGS